MVFDSIYMKTSGKQHRSVVFCGRGFGRVLQKDMKEHFGLIVVVITWVYTIAKTHQSSHLKWVNFT